MQILIHALSRLRISPAIEYFPFTPLSGALSFTYSLVMLSLCPGLSAMDPQRPQGPHGPQGPWGPQGHGGSGQYPRIPGPGFGKGFGKGFGQGQGSPGFVLESDLRLDLDLR